MNPSPSLVTTPAQALQHPNLAWRALLFATIAVLFVVLQIQHSLDQGPLAFPITYDDSTYYWEGLQRLYRAYDLGIRTLVTDYIARPPHSSWSTAVALSGFAVFGPMDWAPIAFNAVVVAVAAIALAVVTRTLPLWQALAIFLAVLTWRFTGHLAMEARPDMVWGLALAAFVAVASRYAIGDLSRRWQFAGALLLALALITKMTTAPVTIAVTLVVAVTSVMIRRSRLALKWRDSVHPLLWMLVVAALICIPVYAGSATYIAGYIYDNVFGRNAGVWEQQMSLREHALYHLTGVGGGAMMSGWLYLWLATLIGCAVMARRRGDQDAVRVALPFAAAFAVGFLAVTLPAHKSPHIGAVVPAMFLVSWVVMVCYAARHPARSPGSKLGNPVLLLWLFPVAGLLVFQWHSTLRFGPNTLSRSKDAAGHRGNVQQMLVDLESNGIVQGNVFFVGSALYLNAETMRYYVTKRRRPAPQFGDDIFSTDLKLLDDRIRTSTSIVTFSDDNGDLALWLPSGKPAVQRHATQTLATMADDFQVFRYPSPKGGEARMHVRRGPFQGIEAGMGLGNLEGPFPQWNLPIVRWGLGKESSVHVVGATGANARLRIEAQTPLEDQRIKVLVNGKAAGEFRFSAREVPQAFDLELGELPAASTIILQYARSTEPSPNDPRRMAVLFRRLQVY
jgi:hypothetical protein